MIRADLAFHFIMNAMPPLLLFRDYVCPGACEEALTALERLY
jgi:hypothetical protein